MVERLPYTGPVLPGSRWRSRGTGGHGTGETVTVVRLTTTGRVCFTRDRVKRGRSEARNTIDEPVFRRQFALVTLPKTAMTVRALAYSAALQLAGRGLVDDDTWERELRMSDVVDRLTPAAPQPEGRTTLGYFNEGTNDGPPPAHPQPKTEPPLLTTEAVTGQPDGPPGEPVTQELAADPVDAFLAHGRRIIEQVMADVRRAEEDLALATLEVEEQTTRLLNLRDRRQRIERAIEAAIKAVEGDDDAPEAGKKTEPAPPPTVVMGRHPRKAAAPTQGDWIMSRFGEQQRWAVRDLARAFMVAYGMEYEPARKTVASFIGKRMGHKPPLHPQLVRVGQGVYEVVD